MKWCHFVNLFVEQPSYFDIKLTGVIAEKCMYLHSKVVSN